MHLRGLSLVASLIALDGGPARLPKTRSHASRRAQICVDMTLVSIAQPPIPLFLFDCCNLLHSITAAEIVTRALLLCEPNVVVAEKYSSGERGCV